MKQDNGLPQFKATRQELTNFLRAQPWHAILVERIHRKTGIIQGRIARYSMLFWNIRATLRKAA